MRPIQLKMKAFGAFREETVIDFDKFGDGCLYLISGDTGAGKTTIFDAICYALYDASSGSRRDGRMMRSDFAGPDEETYVDLTFESQGEIYTVRRSPSYERKKKRGDGVTREEASVLLTLPDGRAFERQKEVNKLIEEEIGMNVENFRQMVMIAQNDFRRMLEATKSEQSAVFREIFSTEPFQKFSKTLKDKARALESEAGEKIAVIESGLSHIDVSGLSQSGAQMLGLTLKSIRAGKKQAFDIDKLTAFLDVLDEENRRLREKIDIEREAGREAEQAVTRASAALKAARDTNALIGALKEDKQKRARLITLEGEYEEERRRLERASRIREKLLSPEKQITDGEERLASLKEDLSDEREHLNEAEGLLEAFNEGSSERERRKREIEAFSDEEKALERDQEKFKSLMEMEEEIKDAEKRLSSEEDALSSLEAALKKDKEREEALREEEGKTKDLPARGEALDAKSERLRERTRAFKDEEERFLSLGPLQIAIQDKRSAYKKASDQAGRLQRAYDALFEAYLKGEAASLAQTLEEGKPCPVCGSIHHPCPAKPTGEVITKQELDRAADEQQKKLDEKTKLSEEGKRLREKYDETSQALLKALSSLTGEPLQGSVKETLEKIRNSLLNQEKELSEEKSAIEEARKRRDEVLGEIRKLEARLKERDEAIGEKRARVLKLKERVASLEGKRESALDALSRKDPGEALNRLDELKRKIADLRREAEDDEKKQQSLLQKTQNLQGRIRVLTDSIKKEEKNLSDKKESFELLLSREGFLSADDYQTAKLGDKEYNGLKKKIEAYDKQRQSLDASIRAREESLGGKEEVDTHALEKALVSLEEAHREREKSLEALSRIDAVNAPAGENLREQEKNARRTMIRYADYRELSKIANDPRHTFEQYIQGVYFERILMMANLRLDKMTGGRYALVQDEKSALQINVFDQETGKTRSVKTLSGGESFKASLALALGVSDVVQSMHGSVEIDTIFIDEGFGTLDAESLDQAIAVLSDLSKDRQVGIISHVDELKTRIPDQIVVEKANSGSRASVRTGLM